MDTQLFGFFGSSTHASPISTLVEYGNKANCDATPSVLSEDSTFSFAIWSKYVSEKKGIHLSINGTPIISGTSTSTTWADTANSIIDTYRKYGSKFLEHISGRFSLVLIDKRSHTIILAIDPMGIGRIAYCESNNSIIFSDSAELIAKSPAMTAKMKNQAIYDYLMLHMIPAPNTIFEGVKKLQPGCYVIYENNKLIQRRYWKPVFCEAATITRESLKTELFSALRKGIADCSPDAQTGAFLSGGLDSSTVAGLLSEQVSLTNTFSIGFGYPDYDELPYARIANRRFGCNGYEYIINGKNIADSFSLIAKAYDEPFGNSSALPTYYCGLLAKENGVNHLLAGDGGDELFAGNSRYAEHEIFRHYQRIPTALRQKMLEPLLAHWPSALSGWPIRKARGYIEKANTPLPARLETWNLLHRLGAAAVLDPDFLSQIDILSPFNDMDEVWHATPAKSQLSHMLYYDWHYTLAYNDLRKVETMSQLAGIRVSYPILHPSVIELSTRIPPHILMPGTKLRHFYKQAMQGFLPDEIINKKKHGFGLPFGLWLQESPQLREMIFSNLLSLRQRKIIQPKFIDQLLKLHGHDDARYYGVFVWVLAMLEQWFQEHRACPS